MCILFIWWSWNTKHHLYAFMVKCVILNVNRINFYQEQCTVTLIQRKRRSKNRQRRNDRGTAAHATLLLDAHALLLLAVWMHPFVNMHAEKNTRCWRSAHACGVKQTSTLAMQRSHLLLHGLLSCITHRGASLYRRQTNGPLTALFPCTMAKKQNKTKQQTFCSPIKCVGPPGKCAVCLIANPALVLFI